MNRYRIALASILCFFFANLHAQKAYKGIMNTKLGASYEGTITINLDGPNDELIEIVTNEKSKAKGKRSSTKSTMTSSMKLNAAVISSLIIDGKTYYLRDIKYDYNEKYYRNVPVQLINGTLNSGMFQYGPAGADENIAVKLPKNEYSQLVAANFDYYRVTSGWHIMAYGECPSLRAKLESGGKDYSWDDNTSMSERIRMWTEWIREFNSCKK